MAGWPWTETDMASGCGIVKADTAISTTATIMQRHGGPLELSSAAVWMAAASAVGRVPGLCQGAVSIESARSVAAVKPIAITAGVAAIPGASGLILTPVESYRF